MPGHAESHRSLDKYNNIYYKRYYLSDPGCQCRSLDAHFREKPNSKDQHRIQNNIDNTSAKHTDHRYFHSPFCLKNLFKCNRHYIRNGKRKDDPCIFYSIFQYRLLVRKHPYKITGKSDTKQGKHDSMHDAEQCSGSHHIIGIFSFPGSQVKCSCRIDSDTKSYGNRRFQ